MAEVITQFDASKVVADLPEVNTAALAELGAGADDSAGYTLEGAPPAESEPAAAGGGFRFVSERHPVECRADGRFYHETTGAELRDLVGRTFDPAVHDCDPAEQPLRPVLTRAGLIRRRAGAPPTLPQSAPAMPAATVVVLPEREPGPSAPPPPGPAIAPEDPPQPGAAELLGQVGSDANDVAAEAFAKVLVASLSGAAVAIAGDWAEQTEPETEVQLLAWTAYLRTLDMTAAPPWSIPLLATLPWVGRVARDKRSPWKRPRITGWRKATDPPTDEQVEAEDAAPPEDPGPPSQFPPEFDRSSLDS